MDEDHDRAEAGGQSLDHARAGIHQRVRGARQADRGRVLHKYPLSAEVHPGAQGLLAGGGEAVGDAN